MAHTFRRHRWLLLAVIALAATAAVAYSGAAAVAAQDAGRPAGVTLHGCSLHV
jgi:hypothetical protein